jgi:hypothetical protein
MGETIAAVADEAGIPASRIGTVGGEEITFEQDGIRAAVALSTAIETHTQAIPRRMAAHR